MTAPQDTAALPPVVHLAGMMGGTTRYIEEQEAQGQREMVTSTVLPKDLNGCTEEQFIALGFTFGPSTDDLFREATLPSGWSRKGSGHSMWSYIDDERGIERVAIFYKAAFYDRSAHMHLSNVGGVTASKAIYSPEEFEEAVIGLLTDAERSEFMARLQSALESTKSEWAGDSEKARAPHIEALIGRFQQ